jgi:hypothetical protein
MSTQNRTNAEQIEGRIYQQDLTIKKVSNQSSQNFGKEFISGSIDVATTDDDMNVLTIYYRYVTATTKSGGENKTYTALKRIMDEDKTIVKVGHDAAMKVRCTPSLAVNDFYPRGQEEVVSQVRNEGGFVNIINELTPQGIERNKFTTDLLITNVTRKDDDENGTYATLRAAAFNFRGDIIPATFTLRNEDAISYFESLDPSTSQPVFTKVWGKIVSRIETQKTEEESAFGEPEVDIKQRRVREWVITGAAKEPYGFGEGEVLTPEDVQKAMENRNVMLAERKANSEQYYASHGQGNTESAFANSETKIPTGDFKF